MDLDDLYDDIRNTAKRIKAEELLEFEQALITEKSKHNAFSVNREIVNSKLFHDKFEKLPLNKDALEAAYRQAGRLLEFIDNLDDEHMSEERLLAINARTGELVVDNFQREGSIYNTGFNDKEFSIIDSYREQIVLIHNHSLNGRPSGQDLLSYLHYDKVKLSLIVCHDGTVYGILNVKQAFEKIYLEEVEKFKLRVGDIREAKKLAMTQLYKINNGLSEKHKLFIVTKL